MTIRISTTLLAIIERLATIERRQEDDAATFGEHSRRINALETAMRSEHRTMHATFNEHQARLDALEQWRQHADDFDALMQELDNTTRGLVDDPGQLSEAEELELDLINLDDALTMQINKLTGRIEALSHQFGDAMKRVDLGLPGEDQMHEQYDAEHDAAPITSWDMRLLHMIATVNDRLGVAIGGA